jgi:hypothetical protein
MAALISWCGRNRTSAGRQTGSLEQATYWSQLLPRRRGNSTTWSTGAPLVATAVIALSNWGTDHPDKLSAQPMTMQSRPRSSWRNVVYVSILSNEYLSCGLGDDPGHSGSPRFALRSADRPRADRKVFSGKGQRQACPAAQAEAEDQRSRKEKPRRHRLGAPGHPKHIRQGTGMHT